MVRVLKDTGKEVYATDTLIITKDNQKTTFGSPFVAEIDDMTLFVLAFEEIKYSKERSENKCCRD